MSKDVSQQAQIISPVKDPFTNGYSWERITAIGGAIILGVGSASFSLFSYPHPFWIPSTLVLCGTIATYGVFARDEETLSHNLRKFKFHRREKKGYETLSKFSEKATDKQVLDHIPWKEIDEETGLSEFACPNTSEYFGNYGFTALAVSPPEIDRDTMNENFRRAFRALPKGCYQKTIMMTGIDPVFILNDIDELLKQPKLTPVRKAELLSMKKKFTQKTGMVDRTTLIYIGLPYTAFKDKAQKEMNRVINRYFKILGKRGVKTVIIKEHQDMIDIYQGMLTGKKIYGVV